MSHYRTAFATSALFLFRLCVALIVIFKTSDLTGQDKLGRIRSATRKPTVSKPQPPAPRKAPKRSESKRSGGSRKSQEDDSAISVVASLVTSNSNSNRKSEPTQSRQSGKLSNVRRAVRQPQTKRPPVKQPAPPARRRQNSRRDPFPRPLIGSNACYHPQPRFVPRPPRRFPTQTVVIHETIPVYAAPQPVVVSQPPMLHAPVAPLVPVAPQPPTIVSAPQTESYVSQPEVTPVSTAALNAVGADWFNTTDSRLWAGIGSDFDGLTVGTLGLTLQQARGLGLDLSVSTFRESGTNFRDNLWIGDVNLMYQIVNRQRLKMKLGAGVNWLGDRFGGEAGFNLTAESELKLGNRWSLVGQGDIGSLGDADFLHGRLSLHRQLDGAEWILGVEHYDIGGAKLESVFTGFGVRF